MPPHNLYVSQDTDCVQSFGIIGAKAQQKLRRILMNVEPGPELYRGKTKVVNAVVGEPTLCILRNTENITANDDANLTRSFSSKATAATQTTCSVFALLQAAGIPVAYRKQLSPTDFLAPRCDMIALECIARRVADGSMLKRFPHLKKGKGELPHRFHRLKIEFFLKTTGGKFPMRGGGQALRMPPNVQDEEGRPVEDPLILNPYDVEWELSHPKIPAWDPTSCIAEGISRYYVLPHHVKIEELEALTRKTFLVLERAWGMMGWGLRDFKIEFGVTVEGELVVADVIDNDSWRLRTPDGREVSKQKFRDGDPLADVQEAYELVAAQSQRFRLPKQAVVYWRGSESDPLPAWVKEELPGIAMESIACSAHKSPNACFAHLDRLLASYPDGGVIITAAGKSNGLGPMLAARSAWPVLSTCPTLKEFPDDVWSSVRMPSLVPLSVLPDAENVLLHAFNILGISNPAAYALRQYELEQLDD